MNRPAAFTLKAVGDIMLGDSAVCVGFGFHSRYPGMAAAEALRAVAGRLSGADLVLGNLECTLTPRGLGTSRWRRDQMRGDPEYAVVLQRLGFTTLGVANNHATQHGGSAFQETVECLRAAGLDVIGLRGHGPWVTEPVIRTTEAGTRVGLLGYCWRPRQYGRDEPPYAEVELPRVLEDVTRLRRDSDAVIVSLHWGEEFVEQPSRSEVAAARAMVEAGALAVVGHHPHVLRPCERVGESLVAYSLGNFCSDMLWQPALRRGAILDLAWDGSRAGAGLTPVQVDDAYRPLPGDRYALNREILGGMPEEEYRQAVALTLARQRLAAYRYAAAHVHRYPPGVLGELALTTARNKVDALVRRFRGGRQ